MRKRRRLRFALIGFGAIAEEMVRCLEADAALETLHGVLVRAHRAPEIERKAAGRFDVVDSIAALLALEPDVVVECAGHAALREFAPTVLAHGTDLMCASVGALADGSFAAQLEAACKNGAQVWIPSGALAGIDGLLAARTAGLRQVTYTSMKAPEAWKGTAAEARANAAERVVLFEGSARDAAVYYPQNANVAATVAFAGVGLDRTTVKLVSDPAVRGPLGIIEADGDFGTFRFEMLGYASPRNPKTSTLTAHSILMALREGMCFALK